MGGAGGTACSVACASASTASLDKSQEWLYFAPLSGYEMYRVRMTDLLDTTLSDAQLSAKIEFYAHKPYNGGLTIDANNNLYLTEIGRHTIGIIPPDTRQYRDYVSDPSMVWPDGVTFISDGFMYSGGSAADSDRSFPEQCDTFGHRKQRGSVPDLSIPA
jgi:sugar lactone lactonase YvrE